MFLSTETFDSVKLLGITIDDNLKFDMHVENICKKASQQLNILYRFKMKSVPYIEHLY